MSRINIMEMLEQHGIKEENFRAYFGLNYDMPKKVYAAIINRREGDGILNILTEMLNDETIVEEIKNFPVDYEQIALIEGMTEPPMTEKKMYMLFFDGKAYTGNTYVQQGQKYALLDNKNPKLYSTAAMAERSAKKLTVSCVNTKKYEIIEVD